MSRVHVCVRPEPHGPHLSGLADSIQCPGRGRDALRHLVADLRELIRQAVADHEPRDPAPAVHVEDLEALLTNPPGGTQ